jgi:hypothetical protein
MLHYYFGDDIFTSRKKLFLVIDKIKTGEKNVRLVKLNPREFEEVKCQQLFSGQNLFGEKLVILIERLSSFPSNKKKRLIDLLIKTEKAEIFIWENREVALPAKLKNYPAGINQLRFPQPKLIFRLGDLIYPGNQKTFLPLLAQILEKQPVELVYFFLKRQFHQLFLFSIQLPPIVSLPSLPGWKRQKLKNQMRNFPPDKFFPFYLRFIELDYQNKTGQLQEGLNIALVNLLSTI